MGVDVLTYKVVSNSTRPRLIVDDLNGQIHIIFIGSVGYFNFLLGFARGWCITVLL